MFFDELKNQMAELETETQGYLSYGRVTCGDGEVLVDFCPADPTCVTSMGMALAQFPLFNEEEDS